MLDFILDHGNAPDTDDGDDDHYEGIDLTIPPRRYEKLEMNGDTYDLRNPLEAKKAVKAAHQYRQDLNDHNLPEYEGKSTEMWGGGRSRLLYDELRADFAADKLAGKHEMTWDQQHMEAKRIIKMRAIQVKTQGVL